jgi:hypothetical protein
MNDKLFLKVSLPDLCGGKIADGGKVAAVGYG